MSSFNETVECFCCSELNKETIHCIKIDSAKWNELDVQNTIESHLWSLKTFKSTSPWLCFMCWRALQDFHDFYRRIEDAQQYFESETVPSSLVIQCTNSSAANLLEPEIIIDHSIVKQENDDPIDNDDDVPTEDSSNTSAVDDSETSIWEDSMEKSKTLRIIQIKGGRDREPNIYSVKTETPEVKSEPSDELKTCENKPSRKSYYQPKTNRHEYDAFLAKHFKLSCQKCQKPFDTFPLLLKHFSKEHQERGYMECCETKYYSRNLLVDHINYHLNPEYFKCKHCSKILTHRKSLSAHMKLHKEKQHTCDICQKKFVKKCKLDLHKLTHLTEEEKKYPCTECGKFFANESILTHHKNAVHLNKYAKLCNICGQSMRDSDSFKRHMEKHEGIVAPSISCDICGLRVVGKRHLKLHKNSQHPEGGKQEYACHICQKISPNIYALRKHIRCTHADYNYKCTICEKAFKRSDNLKAHIATHTGIMLYSCPWCPKQFNSDGNMYSHRKKMHPKEWEEERRKKYSDNLQPNTEKGDLYNLPLTLDY